MASRLDTKSSSRGLTRLQQIFAGNGLLWALYFAFMFLSAFIVSSALGSEVYKSSSFFPVFKHWAFLAVGLLFCLLMSRLPSNAVRKWVPYAFMFILPGLIAWMVLAGTSKNGADRWVTILGFTIQPAEFLRVALVLWGAMAAGSKWSAKSLESRKRKRNFVFYYLGATLLVVPIALGNLSTGLILFTFIMLYSLVLRAPWRLFRYYAGSLVAVGLFFGTLLMTLPVEQLPGRASTWRARIERKMGGNKMDGSSVHTELSSQENMGRMALASSQLIPKGPGQGKFRNSLALAYSDYLYAISIEEYGFIGLLLIPTLYFLWMLLALKEARKQSSPFRANLLRGFAILYPLQAIVNLSVGAGLFNTGQTLPMLSFGGSSIIATSMAFGMMIGMSRQERDYQAWLKERQAKLEAKRKAAAEDEEALSLAEAPDELYTPSITSTDTTSQL